MAAGGKRKVKSMLYYELLAIETDATPEQIKKAYRKKALQLHPDKRGNTKEAQDEVTIATLIWNLYVSADSYSYICLQFTRMKQAYDVLSDPQKKEVYDQYVLSLVWRLLRVESVLTAETRGLA